MPRRDSGPTQGKVYDLLKLYGPMSATEAAEKLHQERQSGVPFEGRAKVSVVRQVGKILRNLAGAEQVVDVNRGAEGTTPRWAARAPAPPDPRTKPKRGNWRGGGTKGQPSQFRDPERMEPGPGAGVGRPASRGRRSASGDMPEDRYRRARESGGNPENMRESWRKPRSKDRRGKPPEDFYERQRRSGGNPENMRGGSRSSPADRGSGGGAGFMKPASRPKPKGGDDGGGLGFGKKV